MSVDAAGSRDKTMSGPVLATAPGPASSPMAAPLLRRAARVAGEGLAVLGVVFCVPLVILAIGLPIALGVRLLLWLGGML